MSISFSKYFIIRYIENITIVEYTGIVDASNIDIASGGFGSYSPCGIKEI